MPLSMLLRQARRILLTALVGGLLGATLVRLGPGFGVDEREVDARLNAESQQAIRAEHARDNNIALFYVRYLSGVIHGDLGFSRSLNRPVSELLKERLPLTLGSLAYGVLGGMSIGLVFAMASVWWQAPGSDLLPAVLSGIALALPAALIALVFLWMGVGGRWAIALVVFPHVYRYAKNLLVAAYQAPHVLAAEAKGLSPARVLFAHVFTPAAPQLAALAGISVSLAFGASIPIEVLCDTPGVGQLAWKAALDRDLPLLVNITVLVTLMTLVVNACADLALARWRPVS
ncbi:MAG TPA: ABC transporter permease [Bryobacteraceae bacterium]|jgi:peptide/nickel transport system permease protein|nr:ABC transporter permease [Bryobacteraceae bacterium]